MPQAEQRLDTHRDILRAFSTLLDAPRLPPDATDEALRVLVEAARRGQIRGVIEAIARDR